MASLRRSASSTDADEVRLIPGSLSEEMTADTRVPSSKTF